MWWGMIGVVRRLLSGLWGFGGSGRSTGCDPWGLGLRKQGCPADAHLLFQMQTVLVVADTARDCWGDFNL